MLMPYDDPSFAEAWSNWMEYKKEIKKPYKSEKSIQTRLNWFLKNKLTLDEAISAIEIAIMNGWQGIFPPNTTDNGSKTNSTGPVQNRGAKEGTSEARINALRKW